MVFALRALTSNVCSRPAVTVESWLHINVAHIRQTAAPRSVSLAPRRARLQAPRKQALLADLAARTTRAASRPIPIAHPAIKGMAATVCSSGYWAYSLALSDLAWQSVSACSHTCMPPPRCPSPRSSPWRRRPPSITPTAPRRLAHTPSRTARSSLARGCRTMWATPSWPPRTAHSIRIKAWISRASPARSSTT